MSRKTLISTHFSLLIALAIPACTTPARVNEDARAPSYTIHLDRGPAVTPSASKPNADGVARALAFEMSGFAAAPSTKPTAEERASATQAAVIDAFAKALIEARRTRGQTTADFTTKIGPRLTITHRQIGDGYEVQVTLIARGVDTTFVVRDGALQHPPQELKLLRQVFEETNGEFALLSADWKTAQEGAQAKVACYRPTGVDGASLAGDPTKEPVPAP